MTVQEITALRKAGRLEEALQAAENEYAQAKNSFTGGALFWCLNDISKQKTSTEELSKLYDKMISLFEEAQLGDKGINFMKIALSNLERRINPVGQEIKDAITTLKSGASADTTRLKVEQMFNKGELNQNLYQDYGWLIYYTLKNTPVGEVQKRKILLSNYLKLSINGKNILHSCILSEAVKVEKNTPLQFRIRDFVKLWDLGNLRDEDWRQFTTDDGKVMPSLVEKLVGVYAKELKTDKITASKEFIDLVDKAFEQYPNNQYLPLYKAYTLIASDKLDEALKFYKRLIMKTPSKCYLWEQASDIVDDVNMRICLLCKASSVEKDESFVGACRLKLVEAYIENGLIGNAKYELNKYHEFYQSKGWHLKQEFKDLECRIAPNVEPIEDKTLYEQYICTAESFIYDSLPSKFAVKTSDKLSEDSKGRKFTQWFLQSGNERLKLKKPRNFGLDNRAKNGLLFEIKTVEGKIVWIKQANASKMPKQDWISVSSGIVNIRTDKKGNNYAILNNSYIKSDLLRGISNGQCIEITSLRQDDGRWSAISLSAK